MLNVQQQEIVNMTEGPLIVMSCAGTGKALAHGTGVLTSNGYKNIENLIHSDKIFGRDGKLYEILGIYPQGIKQIYEVEFSDGNVIECCKDHLWTYQTKSERDRKKGKWNVHTIEYILNNIPLLKKSGQYNAWNVYIPMCDPIEFDEQDFSIPSYTLGALLGDGGILQKNLKFSTECNDVLLRISNELLQVNCSINHLSNYDYLITNIEKNEKTFQEKLRELKLLGCTSDTKFIPDIYKFSSVENRIQLLQGLIDTEGWCEKSAYEYISVSKSLANDVKFLCESLGCTVHFSEKNTTFTHKGEKKQEKLAYKLHIKPPTHLPKLHYSEKREKQWKKGQSCARRTIRRITPTDRNTQMTCIEVSFPDNLFIIDNCIVTHNTHTIVQRMAKLVTNGISPANILGLSFSNKAARELSTRVAKEIGHEGTWITTGTFHGFGWMCLKESGNVIGIDRFEKISDYKASIILRKILEDLKLNKLKEYTGKHSVKDLKSNISFCKSNMIRSTDFINSNIDCHPFKRHDFDRIYKRYNHELKINNLIDFGDLILHTISLLEKTEIQQKYSNRYKYIFVDEFQDTNKAQYRIMQLLAQHHRNVCVVGDMDQQIYGFQGANADASNQFRKDFPEYHIIKMEQNYRSTPIVLDAANALINHNTDRIATKMWTTVESDIPINYMEYFTEDEQVQGILNDINKKISNNSKLTHKDFAILYRNNRQSSKYETKFNAEKIPYVMNKSTNYFYNQDEVKNVLSFLRILHDSNDHNAFTCNMSLRRGLGNFVAFLI